MEGMLKLSDEVYFKTVINILKALMETVDNMQEQIM